MTRRFPVLDDQCCRPSERKTVPRSVSWEFTETFRAHAENNHDQTLETLARRGGLSPQELWLAAHGRPLREIKNISEQTAIDWLYTASGEPR